jgi:hypothetical protein
VQLSPTYVLLRTVDTVVLLLLRAQLMLSYCSTAMSRLLTSCLLYHTTAASFYTHLYINYITVVHSSTQREGMSAVGSGNTSTNNNDDALLEDDNNDMAIDTGFSSQTRFHHPVHTLLLTCSKV